MQLKMAPEEEESMLLLHDSFKKLIPILVVLKRALNEGTLS